MEAPPLSPDQAKALADIPGNTAKAHGRPFSTWLFLRVKPAAADPERALRGFLRHCGQLAWHTSLLRQLSDWRDYQAAAARSRVAGRKLSDDDDAATRPFRTVLLTWRSFQILGSKAGAPPHAEFVVQDDAFQHGMMAQRHLLRDRRDAQVAVPAGDPWAGYGYEQDFDLALMLARNTRAGCEQLAQEAIAAAAAHGLELAHRENGFVWRPEGEGTGMREPFGFRDGLSNLLFLEDDVEAFRRAGPSAWSPVGDWDRVLFLPPANSSPTTLALQGGSFVVLRKLEQDVAALRKWEAGVRNPTAESLDEGWVDPAAPFIGRTREGCPLTGLPTSHRLNDFNYAGDASGGRCPFHAHIRKANPRGSSHEADERQRLFVRRGMVYAPNDRLALDDRPTATGPGREDQGVGLLFAGYMGSIVNQFRFMQTAWLNSPTFPHPTAGDVDLMTASGWAPTSQGLGGFVIPRGGGYFYAPPLSWLGTL